MSFRTRLILFFALIVLVPVTVVALGLTRVADESRTASTDAALTTSAQAALSVFGDELRAASRGASAAGRDPELAVALRGRDSDAAESAAARLARDEKLAGLAVLTPAGDTLASVGEPGPAGAVEVAVHGASGALGRVRATALRPEDYVNRVSALTGSEAALLQGDRVLASTAADRSRRASRRAMPKPSSRTESRAVLTASSRRARGPRFASPSSGRWNRPGSRPRGRCSSGR